jgi:hypothetical protein
VIGCEGKEIANEEIRTIWKMCGMMYKTVEDIGNEKSVCHVLSSLFVWARTQKLVRWEVDLDFPVNPKDS